MANNGPPYPIVAEHLGGLTVPTSLKHQELLALTQRAVESRTDTLGANEDFLEATTNLDVAQDELVDLQAKVVLLREEVTNTAFLDFAMRGANEEAEAALGPAQEVFALAHNYTIAQTDLALQHADAANWVHHTNTAGPLELYSSSQQFLVDYIKYPDPCTRSVRAGRVGLHNGNHRVGPIVTRLRDNGFISIEGNGNNRVSGLDPEFGNTLALTPRFVVNAADLVESSDDEAN
ncbi:hypothetical protein FRACYDRAFT_244504 [Fragilariopsis cylindrus CCMP1102]|uniref:Uncharacterized protein n=1 Tax=Fragilariopsis cylindrus CCMP1102 TaxID=635003 RepID=A0A1E7F294_9STRA|nr:hypothetical protein FRACYDRAFT_244504 [Fragilariopsis cylindrus CCMP1102]|eukprot:OEU12244.1 hypothetical protein FRACYDRAFT_244504 [Fragilariopsis cylindrus CCMP1102]